MTTTTTNARQQQQDIEFDPRWLDDTAAIPAPTHCPPGNNNYY